MEQWEVYSSHGQTPGQPADAQVCPTLMVPLSLGKSSLPLKQAKM